MDSSNLPTAPVRTPRDLLGVREQWEIAIKTSACSSGQARLDLRGGHEQWEFETMRVDLVRPGPQLPGAQHALHTMCIKPPES